MCVIKQDHREHELASALQFEWLQGAALKIQFINDSKQEGALKSSFLSMAWRQPRVYGPFHTKIHLTPLLIVIHRRVNRHKSFTNEGKVAGWCFGA